MASVIKLKRSSTGGAVPSSSDLEVGEVAFNLADRVIFSKNAGGGIIRIGEGALGNTNSFITSVQSAERAALANTNAAIGNLNTNLTATNTALRTLITNNGTSITNNRNTAKAELANTNVAIALLNTNLTATNTAIRALNTASLTLRGTSLIIVVGPGSSL